MSKKRSAPFSKKSTSPIQWLGFGLISMGIGLTVMGVALMSLKPSTGELYTLMATVQNGSHEYTPSTIQPITKRQAPDAVSTESHAAGNHANRPEGIQCRVLSVYDGDTLSCDMNHNGKIERPHEQVRLIGIDTPEMHYSNKNKAKVDQPFAKESSAFAQQILQKQTIWVEWDKRRYDKYGRALGYVYLMKGETLIQPSFNELILSKGLAKNLFIPPNTRYESQFLATEAQAQAQKLGMWGDSSDTISLGQ